MAGAGISVLPCLSLIGRGIADAFVISSSRFRALLEIQQLVLDSQRALPELASFTDQYLLKFLFRCHYSKQQALTSPVIYELLV